MQVCLIFVFVCGVFGKNPDYFTKYESFAKFSRDDETGILQMTLSTDGGPLVFPGDVVPNIHKALLELSQDPNNTVLIVRGSESNFSSSFPDPQAVQSILSSTENSYAIGAATVKNLQAWANVPFPVIFAIKGAYTIHTDYALVGADIILVTDDTIFQDAGHIFAGIPPGDGIYELYEYALGPFRAKQFHWLTQILTANELKELGLVYKVVPRDSLMDEAYQVANRLLGLSTLTRLATRTMTQTSVRRLIELHQPQNVNLEILAAIDFVQSQLS
eukprot:TRINITY_DN1506_c0_g1_i2.p2 TRINITY_DN1506_c0_g1~~TRINITY_DN1506_c0_g1_i2.p2  ORF type:complete len:274 (+),score=29.22 TRINITY_DN1506_c0_g1_i2:422-1243(+)